MKEQYRVTVDYKKPDGYWVISKPMDIWVEVEQEKTGHALAQREAEKQIPGCRVTRVCYC